MVKRLIQQSNDLELDALKRIYEILNRAGIRCIERLSIASLEGWDVTHLPRILDAITQVIAEFRSQYINQLAALQREGFDLGIAWVDQLANIQAKGNISAQIQLSALPELSRLQLAIWQGYSSQLIVNISEELRKNIDTILTMGITGEKSPYEIIKELGKLPTFRQMAEKQEPYRRIVGTPLEKAWTRAEYITRTELNRISSYAEKARQDQLVEKFPGAKKYWLQTNMHNPRPNHSRVENETNPRKGGTPIPIGTKFKLIGKNGVTYEIDSPHAPGLPAGEVVNCGCHTCTVLPELFPEQ